MKTNTICLLIMVLLGGLFSCERQNDEPGQVSVSFTSDMKCKSNQPLANGLTTSKNPCVSYEYQGDTLLVLSHFNALFNCCPENFTVDIAVKGDSLIITEDDVKEQCKCNCLYNLNIQVHNLTAEIWHVRFIEPYATGDMAPLIFDLDLKNNKVGQYCVTRSGWWE